MFPSLMQGFDTTGKRPSHTCPRLFAMLLLVTLIFGALPAGAQTDGKHAAKPDSSAAKKLASTERALDTKQAADGAPQKITHEGVEVEFTVKPVSATGAQASEKLEGEDAIATFRITDSRNQTPITNLHPSAWMDLRAQGKLTEAKDCRQKIQSFLQAALSSRPEIDLNTYYILALNHEATISVIDPLLGYGTSKLFTLVFLRSPGEDWVMSSDKKRLFVSMPKVGQVAVVDTSTWKVLSNVDAGARPTRIALQPDEKYLWVTNDAQDDASGVTAIDTADMKVAARIKTGAGGHEMAFTSDSRHVYVTNKIGGTVSVIDVQKLAKMKDVKTGALPSSLAFSPLSKAVYVTSEARDGITVIGGPDHEAIALIAAAPALKSVRLTPDSRYGFVLSATENIAQIFDASTNRLLNTVGVGKNPDQVTFTRNFAYVRSLASDHVAMIRLEAIGKIGDLPVVNFPAGQLSPDKSSGVSPADAIVAAPEGGSVLVANPADKKIYYYMEGMAAPMGSFQNYRREPRALKVWDRSLRETQPGVYSTTVKLTASGEYDVAFLLDSPRISHCFSMTVKENPAIQKEPELPIIVEPLLKETRIEVGKSVTLKYRVLDGKTRHPKEKLKDLGVFVFLAPGTYQNRQWATETAEGRYEVTFTPPQSGVYYVFIHCPSLNVPYNRTPHFILQAVEGKKDQSKTEER